MYTTPENEQHMIEAVLKIYNGIKLNSLIEDTVKKKFHYSFKKDHEIALSGAYTKLYKMVEQAATKAIYLGGVDDQLPTRSESWPGSMTSHSK